MTSIGVDAHKQVHVALALDDGGRELGRWEARIAGGDGRICCSGR
jgi:hypothetical protein